MRVDQAAAAAALQTRLLGLMKGQEAQSPGFKADGAAPTAPAPAPAQGGSAVPASSLPMLVAASTAPLSRPAAIRRAEKGVAKLDRLHRLARVGTVPIEALDELARWQDEGATSEGEVGALLGEIELRILVELAKRGR
jgi:hypothetical protein